MATLTTTGTSATTQVRPYPAGGAWNNVVNTARSAGKTTTYGVTLGAGSAGQVISALNQWMNLGQGSGSAHGKLAQKRAQGCGVEIREAGTLSSGQTGSGATTNVLDRGVTLGPATLVIVTTVGATPTCTYQVEGSLDNTSWAPQSYADSGTPSTFVTSTFAITSAGTKTLILNPTVAWRYIRITLSANTNVTNTITAGVG